MNDRFNISVEEFDRIDVSSEEHVFSDRYNRRKELIMRDYKTRTRRNAGGQLTKSLLVAAAALVIAAPFAVNAATDGELFDRLWGRTGKKDVDSHVETMVEDGKIDENGNPVTYEVTMPKVEFSDVDPDTASRLIGNNMTTEPVACKIGDTTITIESVVRDESGIVASYTVEQPGGVKCLNYSQSDNEAKGAWFKEDSDLMFGFDEGIGKIYVDLERSTPDKIYCNEYMCDSYSLFGSGLFTPVTDHITLNARRIDTKKKATSTSKGSVDYVIEEKSFEIPVSDKLESVTLNSKDGGLIKVSPISMQWDSTGGKEPKGATIDSLCRIVITYKDGSTYLVYDHTNEFMNYKAETETESLAYICGTDKGVITLFNRLVDTSEIEKITINDYEFKMK